MIFRSYCHFNKVTDITPDILRKMNIDTLFLDIDNTIKRFSDDNVSENVLMWLNDTKRSGIKIILCSNNYKKNVEPFARRVDIDFVHMCLKPSPFGYTRALIKSKSKRKNVLVCGDQIFTDILGANISFLKSALIEPIDTSNEAGTVGFRRRLFKRFHDKNMSRSNPF